MIAVALIALLAAQTNSEAPRFDRVALEELEGVDVIVVLKNGDHCTGVLRMVADDRIQIATVNGTVDVLAGDVARITPLQAPTAPEYRSEHRAELERRLEAARTGEIATYVATAASAVLGLTCLGFGVLYLGFGWPESFWPNGAIIASAFGGAALCAGLVVWIVLSIPGAHRRVVDARRALLDAAIE